ncbi:MAG: aldo/keto reductase [Telluria sp.]
MEYRNLGRSGLKVSRIGLGCMSYGINARAWRLSESDSEQFIRQALDLGINLFDTADMYGGGESEEFLGRVLWRHVPRDEIVLATKVFYPVRPGPNGGGLSRKAIFAGIDASLKRLRTDHVDLYQIHRSDPDTPIEETLEALHDIVKAGKVRYLGASSMFAWEFCRMLYTSRLRALTPFISMQPHYNLLNREEEREMLPLCAAEGIGVLPWSPLARGLLARPWQAPSSTDRVRHDNTAAKLYNATVEQDRPVVDAVNEVAARRGLPPACIALAWLLRQDVVTAPIVGATKPVHLADAARALEVKLDADEVAELERQYVPHAFSFVPS